jgi:VanZ family protein
MKKMGSVLPALLLMSIIYFVSSVPGATVDAAGLGKEIYHVNGHFLLFFLLGITYYKALSRVKLGKQGHAKHLTRNQKVIASLLLCLLYALSDEFHQKFVPGRAVQAFDICIDILGGFISGVILWNLQPILPKKLRVWLNS